MALLQELTKYSGALFGNTNLPTWTYRTICVITASVRCLVDYSKTGDTQKELQTGHVQWFIHSISPPIGQLSPPPLRSLKKLWQNV